MKSKKILALMLGAIIASGGISQMAMQVYADDEKISTNKSSFVDESSHILELKRCNIENTNILFYMKKAEFFIVNKDNLARSTKEKLIFEITGDHEVKLSRYYDTKKEVVIPQKVSIDKEEYNVTSIGQYAFSGKIKLESVNIPSGITKIADDAFFNCPKLQYVNLPDSLKTIGVRAFCECKSLESIKLHNGLETIEKLAFGGCQSLESIKLPDSLKTIEVFAFANCKGLESIELPANLKTIEMSAFFNCQSLESIKLPNDFETIEAMAFCDCIKLRNIELPTTLNKIGDGAFSGTRIRSIIIPSSVTSLGKDALNIKNLEDIHVADGSKLNYIDIVNACGEHYRQLRIFGVDVPQVINHKRITSLDELIVKDSKCECPICLDPIKAGQEVAEFPCNSDIYHYMHKECFDEMAGLTSDVIIKCPLCKRSYLINDLD